MSFKFILAYLKHKLTANNRHGTHSPFVYKLADEVIYDFSLQKVYEAIEEQRKKLLNDENNVLFAALECDSTPYKNILKKPHIAKLIFRLAKYHMPKSSLVLGTDFGIITAYLAKSSMQIHVIAIEECSAKAATANQVFKELELNNVKLIVGDKNSILPKVIAEAKDLDFVYLNGSHIKEATLKYFNSCLPQFNEHSVLIIADIYRSEDRIAAWAEIKNHPQVTVTIDLFWLGLVYFRKGQAKEHFKLKF